MTILKMLRLGPIAIIATACIACHSAAPGDSGGAGTAAPAPQAAPDAAKNEPAPADAAKADGAADAAKNEAAPADAAKAEATCPEVAGTYADAGEALRAAGACIQKDDFRMAQHVLFDAERRFGDSPEMRKIWEDAIANSTRLHAEPRKLSPGEDITGMKRLGGGSTLVYKFLKDKETVAAFKPFQKRFQSNYRSEIAAYRLCPIVRCGFDIPVNTPVYFDFDEFSSLYSRNPANPKAEFAEIIPTRMEDGRYRVYGTYKEWIPDFADFPIEIVEIWKPWVNAGVDRDAMQAEAASILPAIRKKHVRGAEVAKKLEPHFAGLTVEMLARQISNMLVLDYLMNNWDRFSGAPNLYGVNCQFAHGYFMSIDNGAAFPKTPNPKPERHLFEVTRFSRTMHDAIERLDHDATLEFLFPEATDMERDKFETFWTQRQRYLDYVQKCVEKNGAEETFFFQ